MHDTSIQNRPRREALGSSSSLADTLEE